MSTINTMEDPIQVLDEHPEWLEALRARLLTRELLDLPHNFAMFVAEMREFKSEMREFQVGDARVQGADGPFRGSHG